MRPLLPPAARRYASLAAIAAFPLCAACGGGGSSSPSSPTAPSPPSGGFNSCGVIGGISDRVTAQIVNGTACSSANTPIVLLNLKDRDGLPAGSCSGTIIGSRAVLTAAHCLDEEVASVKVYRGSGDQVASTSVHPHPGYRQNVAFDIGVVLTGEDLARTPAALLISRDARTGEQAVIAGWGADQYGNGTTLRAGATSISLVASTHLETQPSSSTSAVCSGDSGGPIFLSQNSAWAVAGVISATGVGGSCVIGASYYAALRHPDASSFVLGLVPDAMTR